MFCGWSLAIRGPWGGAWPLACGAYTITCEERLGEGLGWPVGLSERGLF